MKNSRREFLVYSLGSFGMLAVPGWARSALGGTKNPDSPHFFLQIFVPGGMDNSYLFDARPLSMTSAGIIQNYLGEDPAAYTPSGGGASFRTSITSELVQKFGDHFSVLNGVVMGTTFDGHDQNTNVVFTGEALGGESFVPHLNQASSAPTPLDAVQMGSLVLASLTNTGSVAPLTPSAASLLLQQLKTMPAIDPSAPEIKFLQSRLGAIAALGGVVGTGSQQMLGGYAQAPELVKILQQVQLPPEPTNPSTSSDLDGFPKLVTELFKNGACRAAIMVLDGTLGQFDTHDLGNASKQPDTFKGFASRLVSVFQALKDTPYDSTQSFWDVTTVMVCSEFGRTLRQANKDIHMTGTDHNPLSNSVLLGGKGIKPSMVVGASDRVMPNTTEVMSGAHLALDPALLKKMGRPFDFTTLQPRSDLPAVFQATDYLMFSSVANTIYSLFGVPKSRYRVVERNGPVAPVLSGLLT